MTGLRKRVTIGFLSIVCLLFFSGLVSLVELNNLSRDTEDILKANKRNIELAKEMLDAVHEQNIALIHLSVFDDRSYDSLCRVSMIRLETTLAMAQEEAFDKSFLDSLSFATTELRVMTDRFLARRAARQAVETAIVADSVAVALADSLARQHGAVAYTDTLKLGQVPMPDATPLELNGVEIPAHKGNLDGGRWYSNEYERLYKYLTASIKNYMTSTQSSLAPRAEQMKKNAYRAVTPVLISLAVMIAIVLMLYYFMLIYCVNPILGMNRSLGDWLSFRRPFTVSQECKDEVLELKEKIDSLINISKQPKQ